MMRDGKYWIKLCWKYWKNCHHNDRWEILDVKLCHHNDRWEIVDVKLCILDERWEYWMLNCAIMMREEKY